MTVYLYVSPSVDPLMFYVVKTTEEKFDALVSFICDDANALNSDVRPTVVSLKSAQGISYSSNVWRADVIRQFNASLADDNLKIDVEPTRDAQRLGTFIRVRSKWEHIKHDASHRGMTYSDAWANYNRSLLRPVD